MRKNVKVWVEYYARLAFLFSGLILAIYGIQAMIRTMPEHRIVFIIFAFIFLISGTITSWTELRRIRKRVTKGEQKEEQKENEVEYPITINVSHQEKLSRLTTFFRGFIVIPHLVVLWALGIAASVVVFIAWWAILFIGEYPKWAFNFITGYIRWYTRVSGYYMLLTDKYPPFSIE